MLAFPRANDLAGSFFSRPSTWRLGHGKGYSAFESDRAEAPMCARRRFCSLIPGLGVKFSVIIIAGPLFSPRYVVTASA